MQSKHEFAQFINELLLKDEIKNIIAFYSSKCPNPHRVIGLIIGDILTFYSITRSKNTSATLIKEIAKNAENFDGYEMLSKLIYDEMAKNHKNYKGFQIVQQVADNYVLNGFFLHAFSSANLDSVLENGLNPSKRLFKEERDLLNRVAMYEYEAQSHKLYVTGDYRILYSYGSLSPEWVYSFFKHSGTMHNKDYKGAHSIFMEKAQKCIECPEKLQKVSEAAEKVFGFYLKKDLTIQIAVLDKFAKNEHNKNAFKNYSNNEDEDNIEEYLEQISKTKYEKSNERKQVEKNISRIMRCFSHYERATFTRFNKEDFALIELPLYDEFKKRMSFQNNMPLKLQQPELELN